MKTKLSHSQINRFQMCGHSYKLHYIDKLRTKVMHGALVFGSAMDNALNNILLGKEGAEDVFEKSFTTSEVNGKETYIPTCTDLVYANSDMDADLLTEEDYLTLKESSEKGIIFRYKDYLDVYRILSAKKKQHGFVGLTDPEKTFYNLMNWLSLRRKGLLMLQAYRKKVMPKINKVLAVQEYVSLKNEDGDEVIGYVDIIADVKDHGVVILDNKTSNSEYEKDSVISSPQLSLYMHILEEKYDTRKAGYIVMRKQVIKNRKKVCSVCGYDGSGGRHKTCDNIINDKRCGGSWNETIKPEIDIQIIIDSIPERTEQIVMENVDNINTAIKQGTFTRNLNSCTNWFGGKCPYYDHCYKGDDKDLINMKEKK